MHHDNTFIKRRRQNHRSINHHLGVNTNYNGYMDGAPNGSPREGREDREDREDREGRERATAFSVGNGEQTS